MVTSNMQKSIGTLSRFVLRARLVQEHSLAQDKLQLEKHAAWQLEFVLTDNIKTGERTAKMKPAQLIPTEQVESAAARARPLFLKRDGVHYDAVLDALGTGLPKGKYREEIRLLRAKFRNADPDYPAGQPTEPRTEPSMTNKQIAGAWLYGYLLHEDDIRRTYSQGVSAEEMLVIAAKTVCAEMLAIVETLHLIERLVVDGALSLPEMLFTDPVTVTATEWAPETVGVYAAKVGTPMPQSLDEPLGDEWKPAQEVFGPGAKRTDV